MGAFAVSTLCESVGTGPAIGVAGCSGAPAGAGEVGGGAPAAAGLVGAFEGVVAIILAVSALRLGPKAELAFSVEGGWGGEEAAADGNLLGPLSSQ